MNGLRFWSRSSRLLGAMLLTLVLVGTACAPAAEEEAATTTTTTTTATTDTTATTTATTADTAAETTTSDTTAAAADTGPSTVYGWWPNESPVGIRGGEFRNTTAVREAGQYDPHISTAAAHSTWSMFSNLALRADPFTFEIRPELISKWEVSDDGLTYTVTIQ